MNNAFISVLGTNDYLECKYNNGEIVKYIQEDLIKRFCSEWDENDQIRNPVSFAFTSDRGEG